MSRDFDIFMSKHLAGQWLLNSYYKSILTKESRQEGGNVWVWQLGYFWEQYFCFCWEPGIGKRFAEYEDDSQKYTATTTMTLIKQTKSETQRWEDKGDGNQELVTDICYLPTYEYTVNGEVYHYTSRHGSDTVQKPGMQRTGYYEPSNPKNITEYQPQKPVLGGVLFFIPGVVLLIFGVVVLRNSLW